MHQDLTKVNTANSIDKGWSKLLRAVCKQYAINPDTFFPAQLDHHERHELITIRTILAALYKQTDDPYLVIHAAKQVNPLTFNSYSLTLWSSPDLDTLLKSMAEYSVVCGIPIRLRYHLTVQGDAELWVINNEPLNKESRVTQLGITLFMATMIEIIHNATETDDLKIEVKLVNHQFSTKTLQEFARLTNTEVSVGHPIRKISINRKYLYKKNPLADPDIYFSSLTLLRKKVEKLNRSNIVLQIYNTLSQQPTLANISGEFISNKMHMNIRTLNRRLAELNTSYRGVVEKYKLEKALHLLDQTSVNMTEIAYQLGFSDLSTFSRAFKRWTGSSPSQIQITNKL